MSGDIIVDGVLASCYPSADHDMAHLAMTPIRWFPGIIGWIFVEVDETLGYVRMAEEVGKLFFPKGQLYKTTSGNKMKVYI